MLASSLGTFAGARDAGLPLEPTRKLEYNVEQGTWLSLDLSADGRTIVFDMLGDLYVLPAEGGEARAITRGLAFDTQPVYSPDGAWIAFLSDRSGAENLWIARPDGTEPRQLSFRDDHDTFISPAWSADGRALYVTHHRADLNAYELWRFDLEGGASELVQPTRKAADEPKESWRHVLGVAPSADGRYLYHATHVGELHFDRLPQWSIERRDLASGIVETIVSAPRSPRPDLVFGSAFRPAISPDGRRLVYAAHHDGGTILRLLDLETLEDRVLVPRGQQHQLMAFPTQDHLPRYTFTRDGKALIYAVDGRFRRLDIASKQETAIPFRARVSLDVGPELRVSIRQETGPVRARLIQSPEVSPDGRRVAFSALGQVYVMELTRGARPRRLTRGAAPEFHPSWSPDGRRVVYVTWSAREAGHVWSAAVDGASESARLTSSAAFYTHPVYSPDARAILVVRSSNATRMGSYMEYGNLRQAELIELPAAGGSSRVLVKDRLGGKPHFADDASRVHLLFGDGLNSVARDGSDRRRELLARGPGWYFMEGPAPVDDARLSPDGRWALVLIAQQLHLLAMPTVEERVVDLARPQVEHRRITDVGADFFEWSDGGQSITWAVGSTLHRLPLASVLEARGRGGPRVETFEAVVEVPRDTPRGTLMLRGATAITMRGEEVIEDADVLIVDDRIRGIGARGTVAIPPGATIRDVRGRYLVPGFIDVHDHLADVRRGVLDVESWGARANLAYGVTTALDPSPLSIDMLAYEDLVDSGRMIGSRIHSTGPALFSFNEFRSKAEVVRVLSRYRQHYRTFNLKQYRTGNRRVRQWVAQAARELGLMPTTEGALALKLDLGQIMDGFAGSEHALPAVPLGEDVVQLLARTGVGYTLTLQGTNGGPPAQDYFIARTAPHDDAKLNRFAPHFVVDVKTLQALWRDPREYLFPRLAESAARVHRAGGLIGIGTHGEMPGLGFHWELQAHAAGGMTPHELLRVATLSSAAVIGREAEFGSLEPGKYADVLVLERNPLERIENTLSLREVMKNGRLYDADTLDELWPQQRRLPAPWFASDDSSFRRFDPAN